MLRRLSQVLFIFLLASTFAVAQTAMTKPPKSKRTPAQIAALKPLAISGSAASGRNCVGPGATNAHVLGHMPQNTRVTISFASDFDPIASLSFVQLGSGAPDGFDYFDDWVDDDSGGNYEPLIRATVESGATGVLFVSAFDWGDAGCYFYKVEVQTP